MKHGKNSKLARAIEIFSLAYRYLLGFLGVAFLAGMSMSFAGTPNFSGDSGFSGYVCSMVLIAGDIVGGLAVAMILVAGVMYAASGGNEKGDLSVGAAKGMITSAIAGVLLYMLGTAVMGQCGSSFIPDFFAGLLGGGK